MAEVMTAGVVAAIRDRSCVRFMWLLAAASVLPAVLAGMVGAAGVEPVPWSALVVLLGAPHVGATAAFYLDREMRPILGDNRARFHLAPAVAVVIALTVGVAAPSSSTPYLVAAFLGWQMHHFTRQNLGCLAFLCRARGLPGPSRHERRMLDLTTVAAVCAIPAMLAADHMPGERLLFGVGTVAFVAAVGYGAVIISGLDDPVRSVGVATAALFYLPLFVFNIGSAGLLGTALAHGAQYLLMMGHLPAGGREDRRRMVVALVGGVLLVGLPLYWAMPHRLDHPLIFGLFYGVTAAHFIIDAGAWKMRTAAQRSYMGRRFAFL